MKTFMILVKNNFLNLPFIELNYFQKLVFKILTEGPAELEGNPGLNNESEGGCFLKYQTIFIFSNENVSSLSGFNIIYSEMSIFH